MKKKLVSVVLPTYNGERFINESIKSVLAQTYTNWELIIVNDCSTDGTFNIINEYAQKDKRIRVISNEKNLKLPASLNVGFANAKGDYYTWTSDDNIYKPKAFEEMVRYLDNNQNCDMLSCNFDYIDESGLFEQISYTDFDKRELFDLTRHNNVGACFMYRKQIAVEIGAYDENMFCAEDYDYWCRVALKGDIHYINKNLYEYRTHSKSLTATKKEIINKKTYDVRFKYATEIMTKLGQSKQEQVNHLLEFYIYDNVNKWRELAIEIDSKVYLKSLLRIKIKKLITNIFSVKNEGKNKVIRILGVKITFKRKLKKCFTHKKIDYLKKYNLAKNWIEKYTVNSRGIAVESNQPETIYPEVSGYYIPTLLNFGDKDLAIAYGNYLLTIQNEDGSWNEPSGKCPYTFDTGMILKGLSALVDSGLDKDDKYKNALIKGAGYILSMQREDGSIATANYNWWGLPYGKLVPEAIHVYCLEPIRYVGKITGIIKYEECIKKALNYYLSLIDLTDFTTLSHFNAYIIEGLIDIGEIERAKRAMDLISLHQRLDGSVSAYSMVDFVCSTGLLQYAICWYKLGELDKADKAFDYVCNLQNNSGGFYGTYKTGRDDPNYFPQSEIAWAVKYFLDAIYYRQKLKYRNIQWSEMWKNIDIEDGRYKIIEKEIKEENTKKILDLGCAYARYTKNLVKKYPDKEFYCVDIIDKNFDEVNFSKENKAGWILNIPYKDETFDAVFLTEALEHCIDLENAIKEITRVLRKNGKAIIIDKDKRAIGRLELADFEQWFDKDCFNNIKNCKCHVIENLEYEGRRKDGLFNAWVIEKVE